MSIIKVTLFLDFYGESNRSRDVKIDFDNLYNFAIFGGKFRSVIFIIAIVSQRWKIPLQETQQIKKQLHTQVKKLNFTLFSSLFHLFR